MIQTGRWIGFLASGATLVLWAVFLFANPYGSEGIRSDTYAVVAVMMALAAAAFVAAWRIIEEGYHEIRLRKNLHEYTPK